MNEYLKDLQIDVFISSIEICTNAHFNVPTNFLWEGPAEPWHPSLCTAGVAWTTSITVPQRVFKGYSIIVLPTTSEFRLAV